MDFNFPLKFNSEKNGRNLLWVALIILVWYPLCAAFALLGLFGSFSLMALLGLALSLVQLLAAYNCAFFKKDGLSLLQLTNVVSLAWAVLSFVVGTIKGGFSFSGLLSTIINMAIICVIVWYLDKNKDLFDL